MISGGEVEARLRREEGRVRHRGEHGQSWGGNGLQAEGKDGMYC